MIQNAGSSSWMRCAPAATAAFSSRLMAGTSAHATLPLSAYASPGEIRNACVTGPWSAVTNGLSVQRQEVLDLGDEAVAVRHGQLADGAERIELVRTRVAESALRVDRLEAGDVPVEVAREVGAQHLAVGHDVVAGLDLVEQRDARPRREATRRCPTARACPPRRRRGRARPTTGSPELPIDWTGSSGRSIESGHQGLRRSRVLRSGRIARRCGPLEELDVVAVGIEQVGRPAARVRPDRDRRDARASASGSPSPTTRAWSAAASATWKHRWPVPGSQARGTIAATVGAVVLDELDEDAVAAGHAEVDEAGVAHLDAEDLADVVDRVEGDVEVDLEPERVAVERQRALHVADRDAAVEEAGDELAEPHPHRRGPSLIAVRPPAARSPSARSGSRAGGSGPCR